MTNISVALHERVRQQLATAVLSGLYASDGRLPSERELCEQFAISRMTLRRALGDLSAEGLISSSRGRGWYVNTPHHVSEPANVLMSFSAMARRQRLTPSSRVLEASTHAADLDEAERLNIAPGATVFDIRRLRLLDGLPVALDRSRVPLAAAPHLVDVDFAFHSLYEELARVGVAPHRAEYSVEAQAADPDQAALLDIDTGKPLLVTHQVTYTGDNRPIELGGITYRGDRYRFRATLHATGGAE